MSSHGVRHRQRHTIFGARAGLQLGVVVLLVLGRYVMVVLPIYGDPLLNLMQQRHRVATLVLGHPDPTMRSCRGGRHP